MKQQVLKEECVVSYEGDLSSEVLQYFLEKQHCNNM